MSEFRCLALETGTAAPTVAACHGVRECELAVPGGRNVAAALFDAIGTALGKVGLSLHDLECIAFGKGPGAFTGLRIAASAAQGLAAGLGLRLCPVSSLAALAQDALDCAQSTRRTGRVFVAPALPAGRGEVYWGWYRVDDSGLVAAKAEDRVAASKDLRLPGAESFVAAGSAWDELVELRSAQGSRVMAEALTARPRARAVLRLARAEYRLGRLVSPQDAQPVYLRAAV